MPHEGSRPAKGSLDVGAMAGCRQGLLQTDLWHGQPTEPAVVAPLQGQVGGPQLATPPACAQLARRAPQSCPCQRWRVASAPSQPPLVSRSRRPWGKNMRPWRPAGPNQMEKNPSLRQESLAAATVGPIAAGHLQVLSGVAMGRTVQRLGRWAAPVHVAGRSLKPGATAAVASAFAALAGQRGVSNLTVAAHRPAATAVAA